MRYPRRLSSRRKAGSIARSAPWCRETARCRCRPVDPGEDQTQFVLRASSAASRWPRHRRRTPRWPRLPCGRAKPGRGKARKAEERRRRIGAPLAVEREFVRCDAAVDLGLRLGRRHAIEQRMGISVVADGVAFGQFAPGDAGDGFRDIAAEQEEGRAARIRSSAHPALSAWCRPRPVVKGQHQFLALRAARLRGNSLRPTRGVVLASTAARVRCRAHSGWPGQGAAMRPSERVAASAAMARRRIIGAVYALIICPARGPEATSGANGAT